MSDIGPAAPFCPICKTNTFHMGPHPPPDARDEALRRAHKALLYVSGDGDGRHSTSTWEHVDAAIAAIEEVRGG